MVVDVTDSCILMLKMLELLACSLSVVALLAKHVRRKEKSSLREADGGVATGVLGCCAGLTCTDRKTFREAGSF